MVAFSTRLQGICGKMGLFGHGVKTQHGGCAQYAIVEANAVYRLKYAHFQPERSKWFALTLPYLRPHSGHSSSLGLPAYWNRLACLIMHSKTFLRSVRMDADTLPEHSLIRRLATAGSDILIIGCGPIGLFAIQIAKYMGATKGRFPFRPFRKPRCLIHCESCSHCCRHCGISIEQGEGDGC
jgi:NADPH:quinone reductase-like Zn-dependent oxidoreductase